MFYVSTEFGNGAKSGNSTRLSSGQKRVEEKLPHSPPSPPSPSEVFLYSTYNFILSMTDISAGNTMVKKIFMVVH